MSNGNFDPNQLSDDQRKLVEKLRAMWEEAVTHTFTLCFTVCDTSIDLASIPNMLVHPRRDGIYAVEVRKEGLAIIQAMEKSGRIKSLEKSPPGFTSPIGLVTPVVFIVHDQNVDLSVVPGLAIRLTSGDPQIRCGEVVGDGGMEALTKLQEAGQISLPN